MTKRVSQNADSTMDFPSGRDAVQKLKMQLDELPEIRQQRVDALKRAILDGTYEFSPLAVAAAMLADLGLESG